MDAAKRARRPAKQRLTFVANKLATLSPTSSKQEIEHQIEEFQTKLSHFQECQAAIEKLLQEAEPYDEAEMDAEVANSLEYLDEKYPLLQAAQKLLEDNLPNYKTT